MLNILLFSQNKETTDQIPRILESLNYKSFKYKIQIVDEFKIEVSKLANIKLLIIDVSNLIIETESYLTDFLKQITQHGIPAILILNKKQINIFQDLQNLIIRFEDILFEKQIKDELYTRINFILLKSKVLNPEKYIIFSGLVLNIDKYEVTIDGTPVELTFKEYELLKTLLENPDKVFSRNKLFSTIWKFDYFGGSRTVDVHIRRLRMKLPSEYSNMFKTVRNVGYMFSPKILKNLHF